MKRCIHKQRRGQTILEVVIALAIFTLVSSALAALILGGTHGASQGIEHTEATALAQEEMEAVRSIRDGAWNELSQSAGGVAQSGGQWIMSGAQNSIPPFTRTLTSGAICRDASDNIATCPALYTDPHTRYIESTVAWETIEGAPNEVSQEAYFTNWDALLWSQTDWALGPGQAIWSNPAMYGSDDGRIHRLVLGRIELALSPDLGSWTDQTDPGLPSHHLQNVAVIAENDAWAIGDNGLLLHYDGQSWTIVPSPYGDRMNGISVISAQDIWVVGDGGHIIHYNGTQWSAVPSPIGDHLYGISMLSSSDGWAVGAAGKILHYDGVAWTEFDDTGGNTWYDVEMVTAADGWLVGNQGLIYHWGGASWIVHTDSGGTVWRGLDMVTALDGWIVGDQGLIYRWNGVTWSLNTDTGGTNWRSVSMGLAANGWAVGAGGALLHWDGLLWNTIPSPTTNDLNGIFMLTDVYGWAVGKQAGLFRYQHDRYVHSGMLTSSAFSLGNPSPVTVIEWDEILPVCTPACDVRFQIRTAPDFDDAPGTFGNWYGAQGVDTYFTEPRGTIIPTGINGNAWVQYRVFLDGDGHHTPTVQEVRIYYK